MPKDLFCAVLATGALIIFFSAIHGLPTGSEEIANDLANGFKRIPGWLVIGFSVLALLISFALGIAALADLARRDPRTLVTAVTGAAGAAGLSLMASLVWNGEHGELDRIVLHGSNSSTFVYDCAFISFLTAGSLVRRVHWTRWCVISVVLLSVADIASRALAPLAFPIAFLGGLAVGWLVRWAFGAPATRPPSATIAAFLRAGGIDVERLHEVAGSHSSQLSGKLQDGTTVSVRIAGRDTTGLGLVRHLWTFLRLRPSVSGHPTLSSRSRFERLSLTSCLADRVGLAVPKVLQMSELDDGTLILALAIPTGRKLKKNEDPTEIGKLFSALRTLHGAGIAHRDLRSENVVLADDSAVFVSLDRAQPGASALLRRADVAQLLTTAAQCSSPSIALEALREHYGSTDEIALASVLQPMALAPWGWSAMRSAKGCVIELHKELVGSGAELPASSFERFRWRSVVSTIALIAAAFILVGQLSKVDLGGALRHANPLWCLVAILGSAITYFAAAENLAAFVPKHLSIMRGFAVQLSTAFVGVAMPPTVGHVAVNSSYLHRQGVDEGAIAAAVALSQIVNVVTTVLLLLVIGILTGSGVSHFKVTPSSTVLIALGSLVAVLGLILFIPGPRVFILRSIWPRIRAVWPRVIQALSNPVRVLAGGGANLLLTASYVLAFVASIRAVGGHPAILPVAAVYLAGNTVGSVAPTPGGVGAVEAVLAAGLSALGIPVHEAIPAVLIFRLATLWLPIPVGWVSYVFLQRHNTI